MQKNAYGYRVAWRRRRNLTKILLVMKFTWILMTAFLLNASANGTAQTVTFTGSNIPLEKIFADVEKQTGYFILYTGKTLQDAKPVTVSARDMELRDFLDMIFRGQQLKYVIASKTITVSAQRPESGSLNSMVSQLPDAPVPISIHVSDSLGRSLSGASVTVGNRNLSGVTDVNGRLSLNLNEGDVLTVTYIGYQPATVTVTAAVLDRKSLDIRLLPSVTALSEYEMTVNTGYQRIRPEQSTGAVSQITTKEYESRISTNFLDGLVNRLPGLMINNDVNLTFTSPDGSRSSRPLFNIRGISTMSANQNPLIVVDGYPTELTLNMIDPNEIRSVTILKDAAAATIYGVRASNGVIVIERKQAKIGKPRFAFRATTGITPKENYKRYRWEDDASATLTDYYKTLNLKSVSASSWELNFTPTTTTGGPVTRNKVWYIMAQQAANMITADQAAKAFAELENYDNMDEYSSLFERARITQTYNLNVSGGSANAQYYITANHSRNRQSLINNNDNRTLLSALTTLKLADRLSLELTTDYQEEVYHSSPSMGIASFAPYEHFRDVNGNPDFIWGGGISPYFNDVLISQGLYDQLYYPLVDINEINTKTKTNNNKITAKFTYNIANGIDLSLRGIYETSRTDWQYLASEASSVARRNINAYVTVDTSDGTLKFNMPKGGYLRQQAASTSSYTGNAQLSYNKRIGNAHSVNAILGAEVRNLIEKSNAAAYFGYSDQTLLQMPVDMASMVTSQIRNPYGLSRPFSSQDQYNELFNQQYTEDRFLSGYANVVYSYKNTYSLSGSMRIDQSNLFGTDPKYKYKPLWSLGAAWNIYKEDFMRDIAWVRLLKLRAAYGFNGNVAKMSLPQVIAQARINSYLNPSGTSLAKLSYANSSLRWEQTGSLNIGLDYSIFKGVSGTVDYYYKKSTDLLGNTYIDPTIGVSPTLINQATINNKGIEVSLHADWISTRNFNWNSGIVVGYNTSKVLDVYREGDYNPQTLNALGFIKGYPVGAMFSFRYAGLDDTGHPLIANDKGVLYHTDDPSSSSPTAIAMKSQDSALTVYSGSSIPTVNAGISNRIDVGSFYFSCMISYYGGFKVRVPRPSPAANRPLEGAGTYWRTKGDELTTDVMALAGFNNSNSLYPYNYADRYVVHGDYITLSDLTVSYSFDRFAFVKKAGFSHLELKAQASNVMTVGLNKYNYSMATREYQKGYLTPTYLFAIFTNF